MWLNVLRCVCYEFVHCEAPLRQFFLSQKITSIKTSAVRFLSTIKRRTTPITMKLDSEQFHALFTPQLIKLHQLFLQNKFQLRIAGGPVRDLLMGIQPTDVDLATDATPIQMKEMFSREQIRMLNKNGEEHGTITCRIDDKENFEITTLRIDVVCDGRRAKVEFTTDWQLDANRRDLTINSLFLELDGTVIDYFGGIEDLRARRVAFVGDANQRIQEDYLRILRYFRFFGRIAKNANAHEESTLDAIVANKQGLANISGERIWSELKKICVGRFGADVLKTMLSRCGLASLLALPDDSDVMNEYSKIFDYNCERTLQPMTLLSSLFKSQHHIDIFHKRCKLSNAEKSLAEFIVQRREQAEANINDEKYFKDLILTLEKAPGHDKKRMGGREMVVELAKYVCATPKIIDQTQSWQMPEFPINGKDLMDCGVKGGPVMRLVLTNLFELWKKDEYKSDRDELLSHVTADFLRTIDENQPKKTAKRRKSESPCFPELEVKRDSKTSV